jgi:hypothetical protein
VEVIFTDVLSTNSKRYYPTFPITIEIRTLINLSHGRKEAKALKELILSMKKPRQYDPKGIVESHMKYVGLVHPIQHE